MSNPLRLHKKLSGKHVIWFGESNQWVGFEKPAYIVFKMYEKGKKPKKIVTKIQLKYELPRKEAKRFVAEIISGIEEVSERGESVNERSPDIGIDKKNINPFSIRLYTINDKVFRVEYETKLIEYYIHPPLAHLESMSPEEADNTFFLHSNNSAFILESGDESICWSTTDILKLKRKVTLSILNSIYNSSINDWFSRIHASAITDEKQAIILSSESGSGKSTLAILLQTKGFRILSDDIVPLHNRNQYAYPVPTGMSVKKGAFKVLKNYFPEFNPTDSTNYKFGHKDLVFIAPKTTDNNPFRPVPVSKIVFVKYNPDIQHSLTELTLFEALGRYHEEAWVDGSPENAKIFFDWFERLSCFQLEYSNTDMAMDTVATLFRGENRNVLQK